MNAFTFKSNSALSNVEDQETFTNSGPIQVSFWSIFYPIEDLANPPGCPAPQKLQLYTSVCNFLDEREEAIQHTLIQSLIQP